MRHVLPMDASTIDPATRLLWQVSLARVQFASKFQKSATVPITSNLAIRAWSINIDEKKLITQFGWKLRDERFEPN